jgi:hypothetical protein
VSSQQWAVVVVAAESVPLPATAVAAAVVRHQRKQQCAPEAQVQ